jgi:hypothetical protein
MVEYDLEDGGLFDYIKNDVDDHLNLLDGIDLNLNADDFV